MNSSTKTTRSTKAGLIERTITLTIDNDFDQHRILGVVFERNLFSTGMLGCTSDVYELKRIPADFGIGIRIDKRGSNSEGETYDVNLSDALGDQCDCPAGTYRGECRHLAMARDARKLNLI